MLRKILIGLGLLIAFLPYLGFPQSFDAIISTTAGLLIVLLLVLSRKSGQSTGGKFSRFSFSGLSEAPHPLHIDRAEEKAPSLRRESIPQVQKSVVGAETHVEDKIAAVVRPSAQAGRRRKKDEVALPTEELMNT